MKWYMFAIILFVCIFYVRLRTRRKNLRFLRVQTMSERLWFADQMLAYYGCSRKGVVLFALRRLERLFRTPLTYLNGEVELLSLFESGYGKTLRFRFRKRFVDIVPDYGNPLQIVSNDYELANEDVEVYGHKFKPHEHLTVAEYVRFIVEYDRLMYQNEKVRITNLL